MGKKHRPFFVSYKQDIHVLVLCIPGQEHTGKTLVTNTFTEHLKKLHSWGKEHV